jgi:hypothetical protein
MTTYLSNGFPCAPPGIAVRPLRSRRADYLRRILEEARTVVNDALAAAPQRPGLAGDTNLKEKP